ncbi:hypothetical protein SAMN05216464_103203 [Mucilaginibacter pineti]|uniref:Uncharacterized protein n=1 Tax=Mucilaginibacter pineti TaxID=1391627 RepID=A0A1G6Z361_9SPHI|nr:hypothetical protein SAMN05216464_103203 [Mucilaginibacter pineti]
MNRGDRAFLPVNRQWGDNNIYLESNLNRRAVAGILNYYHILAEDVFLE